MPDDYEETTEYSVHMPKRGRKREPIVFIEHFKPDKEAMQRALRILWSLPRRSNTDESESHQQKEQQSNLPQEDYCDVYRVETLEEARELANKLYDEEQERVNRLKTKKHGDPK